MGTNSRTSRRDFLKTAAISGAGLGMAGTIAGGAETTADTPAAQPAARVPRKLLGSTGEKIPILLLGCAQRFDDKYDKILHRSFQAGVDYLDTAHVYADGWSHKTIAPFLKQIGDRKKVWITSKMPRDLRGGKPDGVEPETPSWFQWGLDKCCEELQTDYLDLYFMHALDNPRFLDPEFLKMGDELRKSKKTRFFGFSCHGDRQLELLNKAAEVGGIDVIMFRYSFAQYGNLELNKAIDALKKKGVGLIAMKTQESVPKDQAEVVQFKSKNFNLAQAKLKAVWADERIDAAVSHMDNTTKLRENIEAAKSPVQLSMNEFNQLQRLATATASYSCHGCSEKCESHVEGETKIADTLRFLMYHESYGEPEKARTLFGRMTPAERRIQGVDFTRAAAACPRGIDIAARMKEAQARLA